MYETHPTTLESSVTPDEYLRRDRGAETRSEYFAGQIRIMSGGSERHSLIIGDISAFLKAQLRLRFFRGRRVYGSDMRIKVAATGLYAYPDISVVCGKSELEDGCKDTLLNPVVLVEVLSPSTANYDRVFKWQNYRQIATLRSFLLVSQDDIRVTAHHRQEENDEWQSVEMDNADAVIRLESIGCELRLGDLYFDADYEQEG